MCLYLYLALLTVIAGDPVVIRASNHIFYAAYNLPDVYMVIAIHSRIYTDTMRDLAGRVAWRVVHLARCRRRSFKPLAHEAHPSVRMSSNTRRSILVTLNHEHGLSLQSLPVCIPSRCRGSHTHTHGTPPSLKPCRYCRLKCRRAYHPLSARPQWADCTTVACTAVDARLSPLKKYRIGHLRDSLKMHHRAQFNYKCP